MAKKQKGPEREKATAGVENSKSGADLDPELVEVAMLGNQAFAARLGGGSSPETVSFDVVRDTAIPLIERAALALELRPEPGEVIDRYVEILEASHLPDDRRQLMVDKLRSDQAVAIGVAEALGHHFTGDAIEVRHALGGALDAVWAALHDGQGMAGESREGSASEAAGSLVGDLAAQLAPELGAYSESVSESVSSFCLALFLATYWDEEEEEEFGLELPSVDG